jgi:DNA-binding transcriptional ArsR family regulator
MFNFMTITKALSDENRVRTLMALKDRELCVCQIIELLGLAPSTVSKHMSILRQARLVEGRKKGLWKYYRLPGDHAPSEAREAIAWVFNSLSESPKIVEDARYLEKIMAIDANVLCRIHRGKESDEILGERKCSL